MATAAQKAAMMAAIARRGAAPRPGSIGRSIRSQAENMLRSGKKFETFEQIRQRHFWSNVLFTPDGNGYISGSQSAFITPPGQSGQGFAVALTERETNWKSPNRVPDSQNFEITELGVGVMPIPEDVASDAPMPTGAIVESFVDNAVFSIQYLTNKVELGMVCMWPPASAPFAGVKQVVENTATTLDMSIASNGFCAPGLRRRLKVPILLHASKTFSMIIDLPRAVYTNSRVLARIDFFATESYTERS